MRNNLLVFLLCVCTLGSFAQTRIDPKFDNGDSDFGRYLGRKIMQENPEWYGKLDIQYRISNEGHFIPLIVEDSYKTKLPPHLNHMGNLLSSVPKWTPATNQKGEPIESPIYFISMSGKNRNYKLPNIDGCDVYSAIDNWSVNQHADSCYNATIQFEVTREGEVRNITVESKTMSQAQKDQVVEFLMKNEVKPATLQNESVDFKSYKYPFLYGNPEKANRQMPKFVNSKCDLEGFQRWMYSKVRYPPVCMENGIQGCVKCSFVINMDGYISYLEILSSPDPLLSEAVLRVLNLPTLNVPARINGEPVSMYFSLPMNFRAN